MRHVGNLRNQRALTFVFVCWGALLYSFPPVLQPYTTSVLNQFSNAYSLLFVGVSLGGLIGSCCIFVCRLFRIAINRRVKLATCWLGLIASLLTLVMNWGSYFLLHGEASDSIPRWVLLYLGTGFLSPSFATCFLAGFGFSCVTGLISPQTNDVESAKLDLHVSRFSRLLNAVLCLSCLTLGSVRGPVSERLFPTVPVIFSEMLPESGIDTYCPFVPILMAIILATPIFLLVKRAPQMAFSLEAFFMGDIVCRMMLRVNPGILKILNEAPTYMVIGVLVLVCIVTNLNGFRLLQNFEVPDGVRPKPCGLSKSLVEILTSREAETIELLLQGNSSSAIADRLGIKPSSVRGFQQRAYKKLGVSGAEELKVLCADRDKPRVSSEVLPRIVNRNFRWFGPLLALGALLFMLPCGNSGLIPELANIQGWTCAWGIACLLGALLGVATTILQSAAFNEAAKSELEAHDLILATVLPALIGLAIGELWRNATWPYSSFVFGLGLLLFGLIAGTIFVEWDRIRRTNKTELITVAALSSFACLYVRSVWTIPVVFGTWIYVKMMSDVHEKSSKPSSAICGGYALSLGLIGSSFLLTACEDAMGRIIRLGLEDHQSYADAVLLIVVAGIVLTASILYFDSLGRRAAFSVCGSSKERSPSQIAALLMAMGLSEMDARIGSLLVSGKSARDIAAELTVSPGTVNSSKRKVYARMQAHGAIQLKARVDQILSTKNAS